MNCNKEDDEERRAAVKYLGLTAGRSARGVAGGTILGSGVAAIGLMSYTHALDVKTLGRTALTKSTAIGAALGGVAGLIMAASEIGAERKRNSGYAERITADRMDKKSQIGSDSVASSTSR